MSVTPALASSQMSDGLGRLRVAVAQAAELAGQVERGQAQMPLRDHFDGLASAVDAAPFTVALLGLDAESRSAALGWLLDADFHVLTLDVPGTHGLVEVHLAERGYVLVKAGRRQEFDRLEPFLEAVRSADLVRHGDANAWLEPIQLEVTAPRRLQGLRLLVPESPAALAHNPGLAARLRSQAALIAVAGPAGSEPDADALAAAGDLTAGAAAVWVIASGGPAPSGFFERAWPSALRGRVVAPTVLVPDGPVPPFPDFLTESRSGLRRSLAGCQHARRFEGSLDMLEERIQQDVRQQTARRQTQARRATALAEVGQDRPLREAAEGVRVETAESLAKLEARLDEAQRARLLPDSVVNNQITNLVEDLADDDLARETAGNVIKLSVASAAARRAERLVRETLRADIRADLAELNDGLQALRRQLDVRFAVLGGEGTPPADRPDEAAVLEAVVKAVRLEPRYRGELQHKGGLEGVFEWAMHGRRPVFLLTMMSSMGLPFFTGLRERIAPVMLLIFIAGLVWARHSFREEQQTRLDRELDRARETVDTEVRRLYEQALRDWRALAGRHLQELNKRLLREADERLKARTSELTGRIARERVEVQDKLKAVDARLRELGGLTQQATRLRQSAAEARTALERTAREAAGPALLTPGVA